MLDRQDEIFRAMADPSRRRILAALCRAPQEAGELAQLVGLAPNAASFHLRALKAADLVSAQRHGRFLRYSIEPKSVQAWLAHVAHLFPAELLETVTITASASATRPTAGKPRPTPTRPPSGARTEPPVPIDAPIAEETTPASGVDGAGQLPTELL
ncbi:MAG: winged helix-turn-helix transcriptional regulator [Planctomycetes bacterium]|nr:winged helix-turn-helix transcriptional regulator [Planctomycetota bacterium]